MKKLTIIAIIGVFAVSGALAYILGLGDFQRTGTMRLAALEQPVRVLRDERGVPYIFAENTADLIRAQGFVTAQHRLFQLEAYRAIFNGELAEAIGERGLASDIRMRVFGIRRNANAHAGKLSSASQEYLGWFVEGLNAYVEGYPQDHPVEFALAPFRLRAWTVEDIVAIVHYIHSRQSTNYRLELMVQRLVNKLGTTKANEIAPLNVNPDRAEQARPVEVAHATQLEFEWDELLVGREHPDDNGFGSNNWVVGPTRSASGHAIVANDPHLDSRILPGIWHPVGLFSPEVQAVGAALPGLPGILVGRNAHVAFGVTNAYGDAQDLYIETVDPDDPSRYMDAGESLPFEVIQEVIRIRDENAPQGFRDHPLRIRLTRRGPVLTDHGLGPGGERLIVLRSTAAEAHGPVLGIEGFLEAGSVAAFDKALGGAELFLFNFVFADSQGNIGQRATGAIPRRRSGTGEFPRLPPADGSDDWRGYIPPEQLPGDVNPARAWLGTANHDTRPDNYPHHYSSYFAPPYRYQRIKAVLESMETTTVADHWKLIQDERNLQADLLRPVLLEALTANAVHADLVAILAAWDGKDAADSPAPLIYNVIFERLARETFVDELGPALTDEMLSAPYFWKSRFDALVALGTSRWFDDVTTVDTTESLGDMIVRATNKARATLTERFGDDPGSWRWGNANRIAFVSPLRTSGIGRDLLGAGEYPVSGSRDTLKRAGHVIGGDHKVTFHDSMRVVVDLGDADKIAAVVAGGVVGRQFHENQKDQVEPWVDGDMTFWWFSQAAIEANAKHEQWLAP